VERVARTIYKVEGASKGESLPDTGRPAKERLPGPAWAGGEAPSAASKIKRRKLIWILVGIAVVTIIMLAIIAALGASESPAAGISAYPVASTALASSQTGPTVRPTAVTAPAHAFIRPGRIEILVPGVDTVIVPSV
jgi:hypothetical protein